MENTDDGYMLRHNPLGIHALDGADIVVGRAPRHSAKHATHSSDESVITEPMMAKASYYEDSIADSVPTAELDDTQASRLEDLSISSGINVDFGSEFTTEQLGKDFGGFLARKSTITSRPMPPSESMPSNLSALKTTSGPSQNPFLIQRLKSIRRQAPRSEIPPAQDYEDDVRRAEGLPDDVLRMIAFSPDSPWIEDELWGEGVTTEGTATTEEPNTTTYTASSSLHTSQKGKPALSSSLTSSSPTLLPTSSPLSSVSEHEHEAQQPFNSTPMELNPFHSAKLKQDALAQISPSVSTLSALSETGDKALTPSSPQAEAKQVVKKQAIEDTDPVSEDDRGRLFLQINRIANMRGLPIDLTRNPKFTLSLDNGLQTVTTEPLPLPATGFNGLITAKIGQEFELTVAKDLELLLTVGVSMDPAKPPPKPVAPRSSPKKSSHAAQQSTSSATSSGSTGTASGSQGSSPIKSMKNLLMRSPRKRQQKKFQERESEFRQQQQQQQQQHRGENGGEEEEQEEDESEKRIRIQYERDLKDFRRRADFWRGLTGPQGEYSRGYLFESHYEKDIYGKARSFAVPLYNEWDKSTDGVPRVVCELQVTMMYVPKLYGSEQIPMSMQDCQRTLEAARKERISGCEGFLTQQGGDCGAMWRRRYFVLKGSELTGYHEATMKRRAQIHLDNAIDVKDTLSEDLWCIYEDRSFQITFNDGEAISFYADTIENRDEWLKALRHSIANSTGQHRSWTDLVFEAEEEQQHRS